MGSEISLAASLFDATNDTYLFQGFTRHRHGQRSLLLDLVFSLDSISIHPIHHYSPLGSSDHECLTWLPGMQYECVPDTDTVMSPITMYNYWKGNYLAMCQEFDSGKCYFVTILLMLIGFPLKKR